jgi:hypothetical protein
MLESWGRGMRLFKRLAAQAGQVFVLKLKVWGLFMRVSQCKRRMDYSAVIQLCVKPAPRRRGRCTCSRRGWTAAARGGRAIRAAATAAIVSGSGRRVKPPPPFL